MRKGSLFNTKIKTVNSRRKGEGREGGRGGGKEKGRHNRRKKKSEFEENDYLPDTMSLKWERADRGQFAQS